MPTIKNPNMFANNPLDRAADKRIDQSWIEERLSDSSTLIAPFWQLKPFVIPAQSPEKVTEIGWLRPGVMGDMANQDAICVFLGLADDTAHFALDVSFLKEPDQAGPLAGLGSFEDLREIAPKLDAGDAAVMAQGKSMIDWHGRHRFCANCGHETDMGEAGYKRKCPSCGAEHFPRTDPVVIALAVRDDHCLLGRGPNWPANMFSALAGFVEPGESVEEAVARELSEEVGIQIGKVRYHSTQPWPYPSSLMIGCVAEAETHEITVDGHEIAEARWIERGLIRNILKGESDEGLWVPPPMAIAHQLIRNWVFEGVEGKPDYSSYDS